MQCTGQGFSQSNSINIVDILLSANVRVFSEDDSPFNVDHSIVGPHRLPRLHLRF